MHLKLLFTLVALVSKIFFLPRIISSYAECEYLYSVDFYSLFKICLANASLLENLSVHSDERAASIHAGAGSRHKRSWGNVRPEDTSQKALYSFPADGPHLGYATLYVYNTTARSFSSFEARPGVYARMASKGVFEGKEQDIILLVHGWHAWQSSEWLFLKMLRMHTRLTPNATVIYVNWEKLGANYKELGNAAWACVRLNLSEFLRAIDPDKSRLHCIGHSLGSHACAAVCRHYRKLHSYQHNCERIVALDPASSMFKHNSPDPQVSQYRVSRWDANYVAALLTNRNLMGLADLVGDEYLTTDYDGYYSEGCPILGKWWGKVCATGPTGIHHCEDIDIGTLFNSAIIPHTRDSCSHMMAPVYFLKFMDVYSSVPVFRMDGKSPRPIKGPLTSVWNSYVTSRDYRLNSYYDSRPIWYSFTVDATSLRPADQLLVVTPRSNSYIGVVNCDRYDKWTDFKYAYYIFLLKNQWGSRRSIFLNVEQEPVMVRLIRGIGYFEPRADRNKPEQMPTQEERVLKCDPATGHRSFNYRCYWQGRFYTRKPAYRSQLPVKTPLTVVPPTDGCLSYPPPSLPAAVRYVRDTLEAKIHHITTVNWDCSNGFEFHKAILRFNKTQLILATFWDGCGDFWKSYRLEYLVDRETCKIELRFSDVGNYTLILEFRYRVITVPISVTYKHSYVAAIRFLPAPLEGVHVSPRALMAAPSTPETTPAKNGHLVQGKGYTVPGVGPWHGNRTTLFPIVTIPTAPPEPEPSEEPATNMTSSIFVWNITLDGGFEEGSVNLTDIAEDGSSEDYEAITWDDGLVEVSQDGSKLSRMRVSGDAVTVAPTTVEGPNHARRFGIAAAVIACAGLLGALFFIAYMKKYHPRESYKITDVVVDPASADSML